jgi:signal transduction histidine kinase
MSRERRDIVALYNIAVAAGSSLSLKKVIWRLYEEAGQCIDPANFAIAVYDEPKDMLHFYLVFDRGERVKPFSLKHTTNQGLMSQVMRVRSHLLIDDLAAAGCFFEIGQMRSDKPIRSWLGAPFLNSHLPDQHAQGAIAIWSYKANAFTQRDLWFLTEIGTQAAIAIRNAHLYEASQRRALEMAVVDDVAQALSSTLELEDVLRRILVQVEGMLNVRAGFLLLKDPGSGDLVFQTAIGEQLAEVKPFRIPKGQGIAGRVAETGQPMMVEKSANGGRELDFRANNALCVPLMLHEQVVGVLEVLNKKDGPFVPRDLELLNSVAAFAAIAIENARLHESVLAERDRVIEAEEQARKALARDLHDGPIQLVAGVVMRLNFCQKVLDKDPDLLAKELPQAMNMAERAIQQMRTTLFELRPLVLETEGLQAALEIFFERQQQELAGQQTTRLTLQIEADTPHGKISRQDSKVEAAIFAIVQEAVANAIKHAKSSTIKAHLKETPAGLYVTIADDGVGFEVEQVMNSYGQRASLGMINIKERVELIGGDLAIRSTPGHGARIRVYIPKEKDERLKNRGKTGRLTNSQRIQTGMLARLATENGNHAKIEYNSSATTEGSFMEKP